tara:strand:+ start:6337 stop:7152 length:816 start_codon:yes stop_codon:yes gene_type:complete
MTTTKPYLLENKKESNRLKKQAQSNGYLIEVELRGIDLKNFHTFLDVGCGSGVFLEHLKNKHNNFRYTGIDTSEERITKTSDTYKDLENIEFINENILSSDTQLKKYDFILCRYFLHHFSETNVVKILKKLKNLLKTNGVICLIEPDGILNNIFPLSPSEKKAIIHFNEKYNVTMDLGRKLPHLLETCGYQNIDWSMDSFPKNKNDYHDIEVGLMLERILQTAANLKDPKDKKMIEKLSEIIQSPNSVLFHNMFTVTAELKNKNILSLVKK